MLPPVGWVPSHPEITPPSNLHHLRDTTRTINAIERLNEEFRRRIKTQTVLSCAETVPMLLWELMASGQIQMRKVGDWDTLDQPIDPISLDLAA